MSNITPEKLAAIRADINAALASVAKKHDLSTLKAGKAKYTSENFRLELIGIFAGGKSLEAMRYESIADIEGLPPLGFTFQNKGEMYEVSGCNTTGTKVMARSASDGKTYLFPVHGIKKIAQAAKNG